MLFFFRIQWCEKALHLWGLLQWHHQVAVLQYVLDIRYQPSNQPTSKRLCEFPPGFLKLAISSFLCADKEYLHKDASGNLMLHNAETREESLYLSNSTFVRIHILYVPCGWLVGRNNAPDVGTNVCRIFTVGTSGRLALPAVTWSQIRCVWKQLYKGEKKALLSNTSRGSGSLTTWFWCFCNVTEMETLVHGLLLHLRQGDFVSPSVSLWRTAC